MLYDLPLFEDGMNSAEARLKPERLKAGKGLPRGGVWVQFVDGMNGPCAVK